MSFESQKIVNFRHFGFDMNLTFSQRQILVNFCNITKNIIIYIIIEHKSIKKPFVAFFWCWVYVWLRLTRLLRILINSERLDASVFMTMLPATKHRSRHADTICYPNSNYLTTKLYETSECECNNNTIFQNELFSSLLPSGLAAQKPWWCRESRKLATLMN